MRDKRWKRRLQSFFSDKGSHFFLTSHLSLTIRVSFFHLEEKKAGGGWLHAAEPWDEGSRRGGQKGVSSTGKAGCAGHGKNTMLGKQHKKVKKHLSSTEKSFIILK